MYRKDLEPTDDIIANCLFVGKKTQQSFADHSAQTTTSVQECDATKAS
jgi:hypothetical protein